MRSYPVKTPKLIKTIFNRWFWSFYTEKKTVYLTFDDGPIPEITPWVLEQLEAYDAKATFFCIGDNIRKHPAVFNEIVLKQHRVGNHTFNHLNGWKHSIEDYTNNLLLTERLLPKKEKLFRPPYGKITLKQSKAVRKLGYKVIMWDVLSGDFDKRINAEKCTENVLKNTENGSIIVFHDSEKAFPRLKETLPKVLKILKDKGYLFKSIP